MDDFSRLVKYCKLPQLNDELASAFKKADSFGNANVYLL